MGLLTSRLLGRKLDGLGPLRLVAQDTGFSVQRQGFDSPRGYLATWQGFAPGSKWLQNGPVFPGFFCFLRVSSASYGSLLCCILRCFFDPPCNLCVGFCAVFVFLPKALQAPPQRAKMGAV